MGRKAKAKTKAAIKSKATKSNDGGSDIFEEYLTALRKTDLSDKTEHTDRAALEHLLQAIATKAKSTVLVQHEPKRATGKGAPDFKVKDGALILGYVENKIIGENLSRVLRSDQIAKYKDLSDNIIVTDYLTFIWLNKDESPKRASLCDETELENPDFEISTDAKEGVQTLLAGFFSTPAEGIGKAQDLALALATRGRLLRDYLGDELDRQEKEETGARLYGLFEIFRDQVFHELTLAEFADAFAQMLAYGLFLARLNSGAQPVTLQNARQYVPGSFELIRELVDFLSELEKLEYRDIRWVVEEVLSIVNTLHLDEIHEDLSFGSRKAISRKVRAKDEEEWRLFSRDPFVYFYEDFLAKYDSEMKKGRGVYYTPPPVVNFIVRSVDEILKSKFGINTGLSGIVGVVFLLSPIKGLRR
ncbi:MAG: N-6 DNA methylase [Bradyrhizobium sp.]|nr:N-6 DNA methylase [Bradyrhizobium sp.]